MEGAVSPFPLDLFWCFNSGVIVLEKFIIPQDYYEKNIYYTDRFEGITKTEKGLIKSKPLKDDIRRFESYKEFIKGSEILDFGCGRGDFIQLTQKISKKSIGLEINKANREYINNIGITYREVISVLKECNRIGFHTHITRELQMELAPEDYVTLILLGVIGFYILYFILKGE